MFVASGFAYPLGVSRDTVPLRRDEPESMSYFLIEIPIPQSDGVDVDRAMRTLRAAQSRLWERAIAVRPLMAGVTSDDGWLVVLIEAVTIEAVRSLILLALLPPGRVREVRSVALPGGICGR